MNCITYPFCTHISCLSHALLKNSLLLLLSQSRFVVERLGTSIFTSVVLCWSVTDYSCDFFGGTIDFPSVQGKKKML